MTIGASLLLPTTSGFRVFRGSGILRGTKNGCKGRGGSLGESSETVITSESVNTSTSEVCGLEDGIDSGAAAAVALAWRRKKGCRGFGGAGFTGSSVRVL